MQIHSFTHSFRSFLSHLFKFTIPLRSAPDTARILCRNFTPKRHRQLLVKDLLKVPTWRPERESNPRPFGRFSRERVFYSRSQPFLHTCFEFAITITITT